MSVKRTLEQEKAVSSRGRVIVSASAGSGKTFVMIERLISLVLGGADLRSVLAVTFTKKAAAQLKEKLRAALVAKIASSEGETRARLKEQLSYLPLASVSTIHAFCAALVRANFFLADVDPAFRILSEDDPEGKALSQRALNETFEAEYEEGNEAFGRLLSVYYRGSKDARLRALTLSLYGAVRENADYRDRLSKAGGGENFETVCSYLADGFRARARFCSEKAEDLGAFFAEHSERAFGICREVRSAAETITGADGLFEMVSLAAVPLSFSRMPPMTRESGERLKNLRLLSSLEGILKELWKELGKYASREEEERRYLDGEERARALAQLVLKYDERYSALKRENGVLDYNDLEHCALKALKDEGLRAQLCEKYAYVFVDEYQDVNPVQEEILSRIGGGERFLVGDAKQSIYGFRGSRSEFFVKKTEEYPTSLLLGENFRSAPAVIDAVNRVFSHAMTSETAGIDYAGAPMRGGARFGEHAGEVRFHRISSEKEEREPRGVYSVLKAGREESDPSSERVVRIIEEEVLSEWFDPDEGRLKPVTYGDIVVLVRKTTGDAERIVAALSARDIPVTTVSKVNVCEFWEARLLIDWLSYLDNAEQDIPLAGAMLSSVGGFTERELTLVRARFPSPFAFRSACAEYRAKMADPLAEKLRGFAERTERYRILARVYSASELMNFLLSEGLETEIAAKRDGEERLKRVRKLVLAGAGTSVSAFLRRLAASGNRIDFSESGGENAVRVLTMHAAKGLEFPVVILTGLDAPFHGADRDEVMYSDRFSLAPKSYDVGQRLVYETVLRRACAMDEEREELKGELNLLYVAMTRAKYRLHMLFTGKETAPDPQFASRFSDLIDFSDCASYFVSESEGVSSPERRAFVFRPDRERVRRFLSVYRRAYPFEESVSLPVKGSATEFMKEQREEAPFRPSDGGGTVEEGLAYHAFLEHADFSASAAENLRRMREEKLLSEERFALLSEEKLGAILSLPSLAALRGKRTRREQTFLVSLPAREIPGSRFSASDEIVVQGAIDLLAEEDDGYLILDYKYSSHPAERLRQDYATQIGLYRRAVSVITGVPEEKIRARIVNLMGLFETEL